MVIIIIGFFFRSLQSYKPLNLSIEGYLENNWIFWIKQ